MSAVPKRFNDGDRSGLDELVFVRRVSAPRTLAEGRMVHLLTDVRSIDGDLVSAGSEGAVVSADTRDDAYLIEFAEPVGTLAIVEAGQLRAA